MSHYNKLIRSVNQILIQRQMPQKPIDIKDIIVLFQKIQQELNISYVSIVIFTAIDVDSLCTLKIFSKLFKSQSIQYKIYPVNTYSQLSARIEDSRAYNRVKLFLFINCGGVTDLTEYWIVQQNEAQIFLFDVNKPINHKNLECPLIKIIDDGNSEIHNCPTSDEINKYEQLIQYDLDQISQQEQNSLSEQEDRDFSPKRKNRRIFKENKERLRKHRNLIQDKIGNYYNSHFFSYPSSYSAYRMVRDLNKSNNDYLWYAVVGITSMYIDQKLSREIYNNVIDMYRMDALRYNPQRGGRKEKGQISVLKGYQFTLLDHWSLYESMRYSTYLMAKLRLWEDRGIDRLHQLIHAIGISLQEAKQLYKYLPREKPNQTKLDKNIFIVAEKFKLQEITYDSFQKQVDFAAAFMASDYHYMLTATLEAPPNLHDEVSQHRIRCFWQAYDLFEGSLKEIAKGIQKYQGMTKIIINQARNILERDHLITTNNLSIVNVKSDTDDRKLFEHPSALIRLAYLMMNILRQKERKNRSKPIVANWIDIQNSVCLVVGVVHGSRNNLGVRFIRIAEKLNIAVNHDHFMASIIFIQKERMAEFLKEMTLTEPKDKPIS